MTHRLAVPLVMSLISLAPIHAMAGSHSWACESPMRTIVPLAPPPKSVQRSR